MEEMEVPTEHLSEEINERAEEAKKQKNWSFYVAISTALMAVFAAISSLLCRCQKMQIKKDFLKPSKSYMNFIII